MRPRVGDNDSMARARKTGTPPGAGRWWSRSRGLPEGLYAAFVTSLAPVTGTRPPRVLAWAHISEGVCIGTPSHLSYGNTTHWSHVGWHEIERGGWNAETAKLRWTDYDHHQGFVELSDPARLPELFRERVAASIVLEKFVPVLASGVTIVGRRELGSPEAPIIWHTTLGRGLSWDTDGVQSAVDKALAQSQAEYDIG